MNRSNWQWYLVCVVVLLLVLVPLVFGFTDWAGEHSHHYYYNRGALWMLCVVATAELVVYVIRIWAESRSK